MGPKKTKEGPSAKTVNKAKDKLIEDKTFGLKNKNKSKQVQKYISGVETQVKCGNNAKGGARALEEQKHKEKQEKAKKLAQKALIASLFKGVTQVQTVGEGEEIDYKNTLCGYFKAGVCEKGKKCKYSHDLSIEQQKQAGIDIYADPRSKSGKVPDTIITCKSFIDAVEKNLYGFNWVCPDGGDDCKYRHMLPAGYILQKDTKDDDKDGGDDSETLEEKIEGERALLNHDSLTPVTAETFAAWKVRRAEKRQAELDAKIKAEEAKGRKDKSQMAFMSGRALFTYNPDLFEMDEEDDKEESKVASSSTATQQQALDDIEESKEDEKVQVDKDLFADAAGAEDEDVDFDDDE